MVDRDRNGFCIIFKNDYSYKNSSRNRLHELHKLHKIRITITHYTNYTRFNKFKHYYTRFNEFKHYYTLFHKITQDSKKEVTAITHFNIKIVEKDQRPKDCNGRNIFIYIIKGNTT